MQDDMDRDLVKERGLGMGEDRTGVKSLIT